MKHYPLKHWMKASLVSAAALPGGGLLMLGHYVLGLAVLVPNLAALAYLAEFYLGQIPVIWQKLLLGEIQPNLWIIRELIFARPTDPLQDDRLTYAQIIWLTTYLLSIVLSGIAGYLIDRREQQQSSPPSSGD